MLGEAVMVVVERQQPLGQLRAYIEVANLAVGPDADFGAQYPQTRLDATVGGGSANSILTRCAW